MKMKKEVESKKIAKKKSIHGDWISTSNLDVFDFNYKITCDIQKIGETNMI